MTKSYQNLAACGCKWCDEISGQVAKNPLHSLALAALFGMVSGLLLRACRCSRRCGCAAGSSAEGKPRRTAKPPASREA